MLGLAWATFGRALFGRAAAVACGVGLVASILFAPQGLRAADVVAWTDASPVSRLSLWGLWLALAVPPVGHALRASGVKIVRSLPIAELKLAAIFWGFVSITQIPFALLYLRGAGVVRATAAIVLSLSLTALLLSRDRWRFPKMAFALAASFAPPWLGIAIGAPLAISSGISAWRHGAEPRASITIPFPKNSVLALTLSSFLLLVRTERARTLFVALVVMGARLLATVVHENGSLERSEILFVPAACIAAGAMAPPLMANADRMRWILPRPWVGYATAALVSATVSVALRIEVVPIALLMALIAHRKMSGTKYALVVLGVAVLATAVAWRLTCWS